MNSTYVEKEIQEGHDVTASASYQSVELSASVDVSLGISKNDSESFAKEATKWTSFSIGLKPAKNSFDWA